MLYLYCLAKELSQIPDLIDIDDIKFSCGSQSYYSQVLVIKPTGNLGKKCNFFLKVVPENHIYNLNKFTPSINNIDCQWYFNKSLKSGKILKSMINLIE